MKTLETDRLILRDWSLADIGKVDFLVDCENIDTKEKRC